MLNRFVAIVRWLWRDMLWLRLALRLEAFAWSRATKRLNRRLDKLAKQTPPPRTRQTGVLRAVLTVLARGPCPVAEILTARSRTQVLAALAYAARRGYAELGPACGEWKVGRWSITEAGLARLGRKAEAPVLTPKPGAWFPAKFGVPQSLADSIDRTYGFNGPREDGSVRVATAEELREEIGQSEVVNAEEPPESPEAGQEGG